MPLELWIPASARGKRYRCTLCNREYPEHQKREWQRHVINCAVVNEAVTDEMVALRNESAFTSPLDRERYQHMRKRAAEGKPVKGIEATT